MQEALSNVQCKMITLAWALVSKLINFLRIISNRVQFTLFFVIDMHVLTIVLGTTYIYIGVYEMHDRHANKLNHFLISRKCIHVLVSH